MYISNIFPANLPASVIAYLWVHVAWLAIILNHVSLKRRGRWLVKRRGLIGELYSITVRQFLQAQGRAFRLTAGSASPPRPQFSMQLSSELIPNVRMRGRGEDACHNKLSESRSLALERWSLGL